MLESRSSQKEIVRKTVRHTFDPKESMVYGEITLHRIDVVLHWHAAEVAEFRVAKAKAAPSGRNSAAIFRMGCRWNKRIASSGAIRTKGMPNVARERRAALAQSENASSERVKAVSSAIRDRQAK